MNNGKNNIPGMLSVVNAMDKVSATTSAYRITESTLSETGWCATRLFSESGLQDPKFPYGACIDWGYRMDTKEAWDDVAIWAVENFGLPGSRYVTDIKINDMTWWFQTEQDRLLFVLRNGMAKCTQLQFTT